MKRDTLEAFLAEGLSLEAIGLRTNRHPSTVAYWLAQHGLEAIGRQRHAPKGGIDREQLEALLAEGFTVRAIADRLEVSPSTVRHWLRRHGLATVRMDVLRTPEHERPRSVKRVCRSHGLTEFTRGAGGHYRCRQCRAARVVAHRRRIKERLVAEAGGRCAVCGYDRCLGALQFHHLDPSEKVFSLSVRGLVHALEDLRAEASKCALLCSNCHAEVENGVTILSPADRCSTE